MGRSKKEEKHEERRGAWHRVEKTRVVTNYPLVRSGLNWHRPKGLSGQSLHRPSSVRDDSSIEIPDGIKENFLRFISSVHRAQIMDHCPYSIETHPTPNPYHTCSVKICRENNQYAGPSLDFGILYECQVSM